MAKKSRIKPQYRYDPSKIYRAIVIQSAPALKQSSTARLLLASSPPLLLSPISEREELASASPMKRGGGMRWLN